MLMCSGLSDKIEYLTKKANDYEKKLEESETKCEFNNNWNKYQEIKSNLKYYSKQYKHNCGMYQLFCRSFFSN